MLRVPQHIDRAGVRASGEDHETATANVDDQRLVVPDHRIRFPTSVAARLVDRKPALERGHALDLPRDEDFSVEQQTAGALLDHFEPLGLEIVAARRWEPDLSTCGQGDAARAPGVGVYEQRESGAAATADDPLQATVMISVTLGDDYRP